MISYRFGQAEFEIEKTFVEGAALSHNAAINHPESDASISDVNANVSDVGAANDASVSESDVSALKKEAIENIENLEKESLPARPIVGKTRLGGGLVTDVIGSGGMASVYLVWNERLELFRAVKMLSLDAMHDRFETEIKISAKLHHQNIVEVFNVGEWNGLSYMEMEYIDGENLQQILKKRGRFPEDVCYAVAICMANALAYAHNLNFTLCNKPYSGIIHRDLKPANIMFSKQGNVKLADFGIARPAQASLHTTNGNIVGTLHYLSPEQMDGKNIDNRSDIYSLGALMYEMITGVKTFPQESVTELMKQRAANFFKPLSEFDFPINSVVSKIILRCLQPNPKDRYPNAESLLKELQETCPIAPNVAPDALIAQFYNNANDILQSEQTAVKPIICEPPPKRNLRLRRQHLIAPLIMLALFSASYIFARLTSPQKRMSAAVNINNEAVAILPDSILANGNNDTSVNFIEDASKIAEQKIIPKTVEPINDTPISKPVALSENELIKAAIAAINNKEWALAIKTLDKNGVYKENFNLQRLLLLEAYVESKQYDKALPLIAADNAAYSNDAHYLLTFGKYLFYTGDHDKAFEALETSMTRSSVSKSRSAIFDDAIYYMALVKNEKFKTTPSEANRRSALDGWRRVEQAYGSRPNNTRLEIAQKKIAAIN